MASASKTAKGFRLTCPFCGSGEDNTLNLDLTDMTTIACGSCSEEFTPAEALAKATETMAAWQKVVRMIEFGRQIAAE
jgi:transcription elongation factor Elf1